MTKVFSIIFANIILFQSFNIGFDDFSRLNTLLEHAAFHQENYGDSFFEFLAEHYSEEIKSDSIKHEEHENLPFKHDQQSAQHSPTIFMFHTTAIELKEYMTVDAPKTFFYKESYSLFEKHAVFQPPKLA